MLGLMVSVGHQFIFINHHTICMGLHLPKVPLFLFIPQVFCSVD